MTKKELKTATNSDLISRQAVLDLAKKNGIYMIMHKEINELPPVIPQPKWISVSERLPDVGRRVMFSMENDEVYIGILHMLDDGLKITLELTGIGYVYSFDNVTAWMPLPEPYKAEIE